ncbi:RNA binding protein Rnp24 [Penicillium taxi]|uniref:RNA binding protein Rnp24 n=1 Tax=Penicillium taxi TaxID=168475 RepID=UPI0025454EA8|nr:RNA binding protein Rnp24 [Penicillium taxi]KAJ5885281.1 RNA binding protein Rnp24 [Penicillium taxi]
MTEVVEGIQKKRKLQDGPELEIDIAAPEPQSKKALRKAKKTKTEAPAADFEEAPTPKAKSKDISEKDKRSNYGIWIGNLAFSTTKDDLRRFFTNDGSIADDTITRINLPKGGERFGKIQNKGFAYVDFTTDKALQEALGFSEQLLTGRRVLIKNANSYAGRPEKTQEQLNASAAAANSGNPPSRRIFVGNLGFDVTKEAIEENFGKCGAITNVHMATFQDTGKCKGYGWVEFEDIASAEAAVRGYVMVAEDEEEEEEESSDSSDPETEKKPKKKFKKIPKQKVWVNMLLGRRMRMEFAEDAGTRYKKRFGKDSESRKDEDGSEERPRARKPRQPVIDESRYSKETVHRLSGAIVEATGKKTTFN